MKNVYKKVGWRKHLVPNQREWITEYMNTHGVDFYTRAIDLINMAWKYNRKEIVLAKFIKTNICVQLLLCEGKIILNMRTRVIF